MAKIDFQAFDADNHYYEATDAFTSHIEPQFARRCMQWAQVEDQRLAVAVVLDAHVLHGLPEKLERGRNQARGHDRTGTYLEFLAGNGQLWSRHAQAQHE